MPTPFQAHGPDIVGGPVSGFGTSGTGDAELAAHQMDAHLRDVRAAARLVVRDEGPTEMPSQPVLPDGKDESDGDESPIRRSGERINGKKKQEGRSSLPVLDTGRESDEELSISGETTSSTSEDRARSSEHSRDRTALRIIRPSTFLFKRALE